MERGRILLKRNSFEIAPQALFLAAGVILSIALISIMTLQFEQSRQMTGEVNRKMLDMTESIKNSEITQYDGLHISGAEVRNFYKLYLTSSGARGFDQMIIDNGAGTRVYLSSGDFAKLTDSKGEGYVAPADIYLCTVEQNANGIITNVRFEKKEKTEG